MAETRHSADIRRQHPAGASISRWTAPDGWPLRVFDWPSADEDGRGSILFAGGRGDFIEKYLEVFHHWHARGWRVTAFDWRGQGGSDRTSSHPAVGHIQDFAHFVGDLAAFWTGWSADAKGARVAIGHSMGGHLILRALAERMIDPDAAVLVAPMLGLHAPLSPRIGEGVATLLSRGGNPARAAWKGNERPHTRLSRQALLTHDADRYADELWWQAQQPELLTGPPSWRWVAQAFTSTRNLRSTPVLNDIHTPVLMLVAEADRLVDPRAATAIAARLPDCRTLRFGAESRHEILREVDPVRHRALAEIDSFLDARARD